MPFNRIVIECDRIASLSQNVRGKGDDLTVFTREAEPISDIVQFSPNIPPPRQKILPKMSCDSNRLCDILERFSAQATCEGFGADLAASGGASVVFVAAVRDVLQPE
jgi:hypothetical protein